MKLLYALLLIPITTLANPYAGVGNGAILGYEQQSIILELAHTDTLSGSILASTKADELTLMGGIGLRENGAGQAVVGANYCLDSDFSLFARGYWFHETETTNTLESSKACHKGRKGKYCEESHSLETDESSRGSTDFVLGVMYKF